MRLWQVEIIYTQPLVSFIVRTQGRRPRLLARALESIATQSHERIEAVIVEDGAGGASDVVCAAQLARQGVFLHKQIAPSGRCVAGNHGLSCAHGDYLGFLDEDDELYPNHTTALLSALVTPGAPPLAYAKAHPVQCEGLNEDRCDNEVRLEPVGMFPFSRTQMWLQNSFPIQAALFHRSLFEKYGGFDPDFDVLEDWDLWIRYSTDKDFAALDAVTSLFRIPSSKAELLGREALHDPWLAKIRSKHARRQGLHSYSDIAALPAQIRLETPFRVALAMTISALRVRLVGTFSGPSTGRTAKANSEPGNER